MGDDVVDPAGDTSSDASTGVHRDEGRPWRRAIVWLVLLAVVFFASYNFANAVAARRDGVGSIVFDWERSIPLLPWTIVPYWLIDLLYGLSLLLCRTRRELDTHAWRLLSVQAIAVTCFLLFPLRFSFERLPVQGMFGPMFDALMAFDQPFNQAPSLHIALLVVLAALYLRVMPRPWHWLVHAVSLAIGLSVLTTWQHHFIDIPTGLWLGCFCLWLLPFDRPSLLAGLRWAPSPARRRLALRYALGAGACAALAILPFRAGAGGGWLWLCWPAAALLLVASVHALFDERAFGKREDGSMQPASLLLFGPYIAGAWINSRLWTLRLQRAGRVLPGMLLGRMPVAGDLEAAGIGAVVDLCAELPRPRTHVPWHCVPMLDLVPPTVERIDAASLALARAVTVAGGRPVLACCALGLSRSAVAVAAWMVRSGHADSVDAAVERIRAARPAVVLGAARMEVLRRWQHERLPAGTGAR